MPEVPSIKGSAFANMVEALLKLVAEGELTRDELGRRLEPGDLEVVESPIQVGEWIDLRLHVRVLELLRSAGGRDRVRKVVEASADKILHAGLYQQLRYLDRARFKEEQDPQARYQAFGADLRLISSLSGAMFNFSHWEVRPDPDHANRHLIEVNDAAPFADVHLVAIEAFVNRVSSRLGLDDLWRSERVAPDRVVFRMQRGL